MPAIGPVYQPTTYNVGYEPQSEWAQQTRRSRLTKLIDWLQSDECCRKIFITSISIISLFICYILLEWIASIFFHYHLFSVAGETSTTVTFYVLFAIFIVACFLLLLMTYLRFMRNKRFYFWPFVRKEGLTRQMSGPGRNGQVLWNCNQHDVCLTLLTSQVRKFSKMTFPYLQFNKLALSYICYQFS